MLEDFNQKFLEIRKNEGLTQQQFAEKLGISRSSVAKIEAKKQDVTRKVRERLLIYYPNDTNTIQNIKKDIIADKFYTVKNKNLGSEDLISTPEGYLKIINLKNQISNNLIILEFVLKILKLYNYSKIAEAIDRVSIYNDIDDFILEIVKGKIVTTQDGFENLKDLVTDSNHLIVSLINNAEKIMSLETQKPG